MHTLTNNIDSMIGTNGKLSAYIYANQAKNKKVLVRSEHFNSISNLSPTQIMESLKFLIENPQFVNS